jgi:hypothetical protein
MSKMITDGKKLYTKSFIRTKVDVDNLSVEAHAKTAEGWVDFGYKCGIPLNILDTVTTNAALPDPSQLSQVKVMTIS